MLIVSCSDCNAWPCRCVIQHAAGAHEFYSSRLLEYGGSYPAEYWLDDCVLCFKEFGLPQQLYLQVLCSKLRGRAQAWHHELRPATLNELEKKLMAAFPTKQDLRERFFQLHRQRNEDPLSYNARSQQAAADAGMRGYEAGLRHKFVNSLPSYVQRQLNLDAPYQALVKLAAICWSALRLYMEDGYDDDAGVCVYTPPLQVPAPNS